MSRRLPVLLAVLLALVVDLAATGCVSLPRSGDVRTAATSDSAENDALIDYAPAGPVPGADPTSLVESFLTAMTATPLNTYVAREYLTAASSRSWVPERGTVAFGSHQLVATGARVGVRLRDVVELDSRGTWRGDPTHGLGHDYRLHLVKEHGQWRISDPPNRLLIPRPHFDTQYQQLLLYFFDQTAQVLVPEPVYVPRGRQAPTLLVTALLKGPEPSLARVERTFVPPRTSLDGISVPVTRGGTVEVPLSSGVLDVDDRQLRHLFAQLAWTLGQLPGVQRLRVTVAGTPVELPGERGDHAVDAWSSYDPAVGYAATDLFGLRHGLVVSVADGREQRVSGPFGTLRAGLRSIAVDLLGQRIAGVSDDGRRVLVADRDGTPGHRASRADIDTVYRGTDVLRPSYDVEGQLWLADRTAEGARWTVLHGGRARPVTAPGLAGADVRGFVLSRDGTRLVARVGGGDGQRLFVARVERDQEGRVQRLTRARPLALDAPGGADAVDGSVRDVAWGSPATLAVLVRPAAATSQVEVVTVDGSAVSPLSSELGPLQARGVRVVSSPSRSTPLWVQTVGSGGRLLLGFSRRGGWHSSGIAPGLLAPTYVG